MIDKYFMPFVYLINEMSPYLLLGLLFAGVLHAFVPKAIYSKLLGRNNVASVLWAILFGVPLPLCSCGVIPTAVGMRKEGASKGATTAFLIATPQTGVDSILATFSVFGLGFALLRPVVAMITGFVGGLVTNVAARQEEDDTAPSSTATPASAGGEQGTQHTFMQKCSSALRYAFDDMLVDIGQWLLIGIVLAGLITIFVPDDFFLAYQGNHLVNMLLVLLIACPMYVCATGSIPIAAALMLKGLSPGAALVFLMAGPATNMASIMVLGKTLGRRSLVAYLTTIIIGAICFGLLVDLVLPAEWFSEVMQYSLHSACCHTEATPLWQIVCTSVFMALLILAIIKRHRHHGCSCGHDHESPCGCGGHDCHCGDHNHDGQHAPEHSHDHACGCHDTACHCDGQSCGSDVAAPAPAVAEPVCLRVEGMMCNHCVKHVSEALAKVPGVTSAEVFLASGTATVVGTAPPDALIAAVTACGYKCSEA